MIVHWPGVTQKASRNNHPVVIQDIYASVLEWAGLSELQPEVTDSKSFLPLLKGQQFDNKRQFIWHYPNYYDVPPYSTIREGDWKLIYFYKDQRTELYNLKTDLGEANNLVEQESEIAKQLAGKLSEYLRSVEADRSTIKETGELVIWPDGQK
jgi:arylsulfatase A-like enzyme